MVVLYMKQIISLIVKLSKINWKKPTQSSGVGGM